MARAAHDKEALAFRDWFLANVIPQLPLAKQTLERARPRLRVWRGQTVHVLVHAASCPATGRSTSSSRTTSTYFVVRAVPAVLRGVELAAALRGRRRARRAALRLAVRASPDELAVSVPFVETRRWLASCASPIATRRQAEQRRRRVIDSRADRRRGHRDRRRARVLGDRDPPRAARRTSSRASSSRTSRTSSRRRCRSSRCSARCSRTAARRAPSKRPSTPRSSGARACGSAGLIDNVLDFAKIERGMGVYEFAEADVGEVVGARGRRCRNAGSPRPR